MNSITHSSRVSASFWLGALIAVALGLMGCANTGSHTVIDPPTPPGLPNTPAVSVPNPPGVR
jgi:hypothetical protein